MQPYILIMELYAYVNPVSVIVNDNWTSTDIALIALWVDQGCILNVGEMGFFHYFVTVTFYFDIMWGKYFFQI